MANPFEKRATEYLRDDAAFLSVITPEPLHTFFERHAKAGTLYDRLCMVIGTPGSGKTTIATLLQLRTVETLLNSSNIEEYKVLLHALTRCGVVREKKIEIVGCRLPLESEYREFWELPYKEDIKIGLVKSFIQSRAIISWMKNLEANGRYKLDNINIVYRDGTEAASEAVGGVTASNVFSKAKIVERSIYEIGAALIPPSESSLKNEVIAPYHPFDIINYFLIDESATGTQRKLKPLVMLDDAHTLHPKQLLEVQNWLARREMTIGRWLLMRLDAQTPKEIIDSFGTDADVEGESRINKSREITHIWLQSGVGRRRQREDFRKMARSMADKYLRLMPLFTRQGISRFSDILGINVKEISDTKMKDLEKQVSKLQKQKGISNPRRGSLEGDIDRYFDNSDTADKGQDVRLAMLHIMFHRYANRVPQKSLFNIGEEDYGPDPSKPLKVTSALADGARIFLLHKYSRPYYYGIDTLCDGSSENAELFLQLAGRLVEAAEARIIKSPNENAALAPQYQHQLLTERAREIVDDWSFPAFNEVKALCAHMAKQCVEKSLEPNAPLDGGAIAFGILQDEFDEIATNHPELAKVIKFGVAYNAISLRHRYLAKNKEWCLIELTGPVQIVYGLTLNRGGFLERRVPDLLKALEKK